MERWFMAQFCQFGNTMSLQRLWQSVLSWALGAPLTPQLWAMAGTPLVQVAMTNIGKDIGRDRKGCETRLDSKPASV